MDNKENFVLYKQRIKSEIASLDPSIKHEYLSIEYKTYMKTYYLDFPDSRDEMRLLFECDRRSMDKARAIKERFDKPWTKKEKSAAMQIGLIILLWTVVILL